MPAGANHTIKQLHYGPVDYIMACAGVLAQIDGNGPAAREDVSRNASRALSPATLALAKLMHSIRMIPDNHNVVLCTWSNEKDSLDGNQQNEVDHSLVFVQDVIHLKSTNPKEVKPLVFANVRSIKVGTTFTNKEGDEVVVHTHADVTLSHYLTLKPHLL